PGTRRVPGGVREGFHGAIKLPPLTSYPTRNLRHKRQDAGRSLIKRASTEKNLRKGILELDQPLVLAHKFPTAPEFRSAVQDLGTSHSVSHRRGNSGCSAFGTVASKLSYVQ